VTAMKTLFTMLTAACLITTTVQAEHLLPIGSKQWNCQYNYHMAARKRGDPRALRLRADTVRRGGTYEAALTLKDTPDFRTFEQEAKRACRGVR
jgi:hypothetical protein